MNEGSDAEDTTLLGIGTWTKQGPATLVLRENAWVVLVPGQRKSVIEAAWTVLGEKPAPEDFLDRLVEFGELESADKLTALLFGFHDGTSAVFGVKGTTPIAVYTAEGSQQIAGTEEEPFVLRSLDGVRRMAFGELPLEDGIGAPRVESGIVPVRGFVHVTMDPEELEESERAALAEQVEKDGRSIEDPETKKRRAERPAPKPIKSASPTPAPSRSTASSGSRGSTASAPARSSAGASAAPSAPAAPEPAAPNMFDGLFDSAAPKKDASPPAAAPGPTPAAAAPTPAAPTASAAPSSASTTDSPAATPAPADSSAPAATGASGAPNSAAATAGTTGRKRRLVSSSLFDRRPRSTPETTSKAAEPPTEAPTPDPASSVTSADDAPGDAAEAPSTADVAGGDAAETPSTGSAPVQTPAEETPTTSAPSAEPAPESRAAPSAEAPEAGPAPAPTAASPAAAPAPTPPASIPTPEPPEDEDLLDPSAEDQLESPVTQIAPIDEEEVVEEATAPAPRRAPAPRAAAPAGAGSDLENTGAYDDLFGKTVFRRIEDAAVRRSEEEDEESEEGTSDSDAPSPPSSASPAPAEPEEAPAPESPRTAAPSEFIDWVPGVGRTAPEIAQAAARRAAAPPAPEPAYPQVHMAERPPDPNTGSRPAPTRPPMPTQPPAPYEQPGTAAPAGSPMNTGAAGQQLGYPARSGPASPYPQPTMNPGAAGHQVGFRGPQAPAGHGGANSSAQGWTGSPNPPRPPQHGGPVPRHAPPRQGMAGQGMPPQGPPPQGMPPRQGMPPQTPPTHGGAATTGHPSAPSASGAGPASGGAVMLPGLLCANGHANSPERSACRACGAPLQGPTRTVPRPPLGVVLVSVGDRFVLDRTAIIGRRPRASRVSGNDVPQLITVPSPQQDISRSHLELRLEGWHVVALDLGTTNGTTLHRAGFDPVRLRPREGVVLHDGDHLDLGDDVHLTFGERA